MRSTWSSLTSPGPTSLERMPQREYEGSGSSRPSKASLPTVLCEPGDVAGGRCIPGESLLGVRRAVRASFLVVVSTGMALTRLKNVFEPDVS
eukprot:7033496-Prymnesium_polylepis.1